MAVDIHNGYGIYSHTVGSHDTDPFAMQASPVPISQEAAERIRDEYNAKCRQRKEKRRRDPFWETARRSRWSTPELGSIGNPFPKGYDLMSKSRCIFICEYCGSASESVEPCKGCLAPRTREQLEALAMMENQ